MIIKDIRVNILIFGVFFLGRKVRNFIYNCRNKMWTNFGKSKCR